MQRRFQRASLAPSGFAVDDVAVVADCFGCGHALLQELAQPVGDRADEFKADIYGGPLTCRSSDGELNWQSWRDGFGVTPFCVVGASSANTSIVGCWHVTVGVPSAWRPSYIILAWPLAADLRPPLPIV